MYVKINNIIGKSCSTTFMRMIITEISSRESKVRKLCTCLKFDRFVSEEKAS